MTHKVKDFFYDERVKLSGGNSVENLDFVRNNEESPIYIQGISALNGVTAALLVSLVIVRSGKEHIMETITLTIANRAYAFSFNGYLKRPDFIRLKFYATAENDNLIGYFHAVNVDLV